MILESHIVERLSSHREQQSRQLAETAFVLQSTAPSGSHVRSRLCLTLLALPALCLCWLAVCLTK